MEEIFRRSDMRAIRDCAWRAYSLDTTCAGAREQFQTRYGVEPAECFVCGPIILAGPIPEREERSNGKELARCASVSVAGL